VPAKNRSDEVRIKEIACLCRYSIENIRNPCQPFVEFLRVTYVVLVGHDGVDELLSLLYALAAFIRQEAPLRWTVDAYLTILAEPAQKIV